MRPKTPRIPKGTLSEGIGTPPASDGKTAAIVLEPIPPKLRGEGAAAAGRQQQILVRAPKMRLEETVGLARAISLDVRAEAIVPLQKLRPATLFGSGKVEELSEMIREVGAELAIVDHPLTPVQQRNLERAWGAKVLDRTGLILEIFGERARTKEGRLQVELAHLVYQKSRLVRSWTHLERQRGGFGFLGGPGETQIEADRRVIGERIESIRRELEQVRRTRALHRKARQRVPYPVLALIGYTNAGKSTLFNALTGADVLAEDILFATLDPTFRAIRLPHGGKAVLSDTVGFISDLPTTLIAAFRATLEEVEEADLILHVRDIADGASDEQRADVHAVLRELGIDPDNDASRILEIWNKVDLLDEPSLQARRNEADRASDRPCLVSAVTGQGLLAMLQEIETRLNRSRQTLELALGPEEGALSNWIYENFEVLGRSEEGDGVVRLRVRVPPERHDALLRQAGAARLRLAAE